MQEAKPSMVKVKAKKPSMVKVGREKASGGEVCHLESGLPMRFAPRSSGQFTLVFKVYFTGHTAQKLFVKLFKNLPPGRAAGGIFNWIASGDEVGHLESGLRMRFPPRSSGKITFAFDSGHAGGSS